MADESIMEESSSFSVHECLGGAVQAKAEQVTGQGVGPAHARGLVGTALPATRHAGFFKFKDFHSRARTQAHARGRGTQCSHRFFSE